MSDGERIEELERLTYINATAWLDMRAVLMLYAPRHAKLVEACAVAADGCAGALKGTPYFELLREEGVASSEPHKLEQPGSTPGPATGGNT